MITVKHGMHPNSRKNLLPGGHNRNTPESFWAYVEKGPSCWQWKGSPYANGYGQFRINGGARLAHRFAYELIKGAIPKGMQLDHLCRNRACVNPDHLEVVTLKENVLRGIGLSAQNAKKTHCKHGHPLSGDNLRIQADGSRGCLECRRDISRRAYKRQKGRASCVQTVQAITRIQN